jgi:muramidase (phage lysozyme)
VLPSGSNQGTAAIGRYQVMPKNWVSWSSLHFGDELDTNPENQDKIAFAQMSKYYIKYSDIY